MNEQPDQERVVWPEPQPDPEQEPFEPWAREQQRDEQERDWPWKFSGHWWNRWL